MEYFGIWNILKYGIFLKLGNNKNGIFLNMEYLEKGKVKQNNMI